MAEINDWNVSAASNNDTVPNGWPEGMDYSAVNDVGRENMAVVARFFSDLNGTLDLTGAANTYAVTLNSGYTSYFDGMMFASTVNVTNTGASSLNVNSIGNKNIVSASGSVLKSGDLVAGQIYEFRYDGTNFRLSGVLLDAVNVNGAISTSLTSLSALHLNGSGSTAQGVRIDNSDSTAYIFIDGSSGGGFSGSSPYDLNFGSSNGTRSLNLSTSNTVRLSISAAGNVNILEDLELGGALQFDATSGLNIIGFDGSTTTKIQGDNTKLELFVDGSNKMSITPTGTYLTLPTSAGPSGTLWNDSGTVKVA